MRVIAGPEKKARLLSEKERKITAYHEMGHALVGHYLENTNPVHKITIVSRGQALGLTISLPTEDKYLTTKSALMDELAMTLGGRAAEELVFHEVTTGAANDLERVTATSKQMIMRFGMSEKLGPRVLGRAHDLPFLGRDMGSEPDYSDEIAKEIDDEIRRVIEEAHASATTVLRAHMEELHRLSAILIERETIDKDQFERLLAGESEESVFPDGGRRAGDRGARGREEAEAQPAATPDPGRGDAASSARSGDQLARASCSSHQASSRLPGSRSTSSGSSPLAPSTTSATTRRGRRASSTSSTRPATAETAVGRASDPRGEPRRSRAACARLRGADGLHVHGARLRRRRDRLRLRLSGARRGPRRPCAVVGARVARRARPSAQAGRRRLAGDGPGHSSGRSTRRCSADAPRATTSTVASTVTAASAPSRSRASPRARTASTSASRIAETKNAPTPSSATTAARRRPSPASPSQRVRSSSDQ